MLKQVQNWIKALIPRLRQYAVSCRAFFDRNYNLLFNGKNCVKIQFYEEWFNYNDITTEGTNNLRCLGKGWYIRYGSYRIGGWRRLTSTKLKSKKQMNKNMTELSNEAQLTFTNPLLSAVFLFLDDIREPEHAFEYTKQEMFLKQKWEVVRNFDEFKSHIETNGMPSFISFDHDLADSHYTPEHLWTDYNKSKEWQEQQVHKEKTGYECAMWLVDYCMNNNLQLPNYYCHSMNPVGKDKIVGLLKSFQNSR